MTHLVRYGDLRIGDILGAGSDDYVYTGKELVRVVKVSRSRALMTVVWASDAGETETRRRFEDDVVILDERGPEVPRLRELPGVDAIVKFLLLQLDADADAAERNTEGRGLEDHALPLGDDASGVAISDYLDRYIPSRVLREVKGKRRMIAELTADGGTVDVAHAWGMLRLMASAYEDRRGFDRSWQV